MKTERKLLIVGILLIMGALWGGCWAEDFFKNNWKQFPSCVTAVLVAIVGIAFLCAAGCVAENAKPKEDEKQP